MAFRKNAAPHRKALKRCNLFQSAGTHCVERDWRLAYESTQDEPLVMQGIGGRKAKKDDNETCVKMATQKEKRKAN